MQCEKRKKGPFSVFLTAIGITQNGKRFVFRFPFCATNPKYEECGKRKTIAHCIVFRFSFPLRAPLYSVDVRPIPCNVSYLFFAVSADRLEIEIFDVMALTGYLEVISDMLVNGKTYREISAHLQNIGVTRGSSEANIRKFCLESGINRRSGSLSESELNFAVETAVQQVRLYK